MLPESHPAPQGCCIGAANRAFWASMLATGRIAQALIFGLSGQPSQPPDDPGLLYLTAAGRTELVAEVTRLLQQVDDAQRRAGAPYPAHAGPVSSATPQAEPPAKPAGVQPAPVSPEGPKPAAPMLSGSRYSGAETATRRLFQPGCDRRQTRRVGGRGCRRCLKRDGGRTAAMEGMSAGWPQDQIVTKGRTVNAVHEHESRADDCNYHHRDRTFRKLAAEASMRRTRSFHGLWSAILTRDLRW